MSSTTITRKPSVKSTRKAAPKVALAPVVLDSDLVAVTVPATKRTLRQDLDRAVYNLTHEEAKIENYVRFPALDKDGGPMALPMRRRIALSTVTKRHAVALAAYEARYGKR